MTGKSVYVCSDYHEKQLQRALLQYSKPENANLVREALARAGREDLIGNGAECLVRPAFAKGRADNRFEPKRKGAAPRAGRSVSVESNKKTKLSRVFGDDAIRILGEADRLSAKVKRPKSAIGNKKSAKNGATLSKHTKNTKSGGKKR